MADPTASPYFQHKRRRIACSPYSESPYFVKSASSSWGSVKSLGPLLFCLSATNAETAVRDCTKSPATCEVCATFIACAMRHFDCCPVFREHWKRQPYSRRSADDHDVRSASIEHAHANMYIPLDVAGSASKCCWELAEEILQQAVRHLCSYRCYMRAYSPYREWFALRKRLIQEQTGESIVTSLNGWRCILLLQSSVTTGSVTGDSNSSSRSYETYLPRTAFVNPDDEVFPNSSAAVNHLRKLKLSELSLDSDRNPKLRQGQRLLPKAMAFGSCIDATDTRPQTEPATFDRRVIGTPYGLLEELFANDPWKLLLSTIFLNRTSRVQVDTVLHAFFKLWPTASDVIAETNREKMSMLLQPMGMRHRRAAGVVRFSNEYLALLSRTKASACSDEKVTVEKAGPGDSTTDPNSSQPGYTWTRDDILSLFYCGEYACDAYQLFIQRNWNIDPLDHALKAYAEFQRGQQHKGKSARVN